MSAVKSVDRDTVGRRAYELYCARGCVDGRDVDDWLEAERELLLTPSQDNPEGVAAKRLQEAGEAGPRTDQS